MRWKTSPVIGSSEDFLEQAGERPFQEGKKAWWHSLFYGCAACVGGATGHIGCLVAPLLTLGTNGATAASGHNPALMIGSALAINTVTLGLWYRFRGRFVSKPIKLVTIGFALAGMAVTTGINLREHVHEHHAHNEAARRWYMSQPPESQKQIKETAALLNESVDEYLGSLCITERPEDIEITKKRSEVIPQPK